MKTSELKKEIEKLREVCIEEGHKPKHFNYCKADILQATLTEREKILKLISKKIKYYSTTYGKKYKTAIQDAFIMELEAIKEQIKNGK